MRSWHPLHTVPAYERLRRSGMLQLSPPMALALAFLVLIALGTLLLSLPQAQRLPFSLFDAAFMATSAVTVTGLSLFEPAQTLTPFGQVVLISLVQIGGLGFVTFAIVASMALGRRLSMQQQNLALEVFNQTSVARLRDTALAVFKITLAIEGVTALLLTLWWLREQPLPTALANGVFHAIAAFNNAGFSRFDASLAQQSTDPVVILALSSAVILGGLGISVIGDLRHTLQWRRLQPYTRLMLLGTLWLNVGGCLLIWLLEAGNPDTLGPLEAPYQALNAWLHSVSARTAGFATLDVAHLRDSTSVVLMLLMFIGGGSLSTASGIKVMTFIILLAAAWTYVRQRQEVVLSGRSVSPEAVQRALALLLVTAFLLLAGLLAMTTLERAPFLDLLFEVVSALSTTGLSRNLTPQLSEPGQAVLMALMFVGRLGPLTFIYSMARRTPARLRYPEAEFPVG